MEWNSLLSGCEVFTHYSERRTMSNHLKSAEIARGHATIPILYVCDFPPSNFHGGPILASRLLATYRSDEITILFGSRYRELGIRHGLLDCPHVIYPWNNETGRWGTGRIKTAICWLRIPLLALEIRRQARQARAGAMLTIAHGHFFIATALASWLISIPFILIVHDDWVRALRRSSYVLRHFCGTIFRAVVHRAAHIYAVSPSMQKMLAQDYGVVSELLLPATDPIDGAEDTLHVTSTENRSLRIVYAGALTEATEDSVDLLINLIKSEKLLGYGIKSWELHLYAIVTPQQTIEWDDKRIRLHGWVSQPELRRALTDADILVLPYSFRNDHRFATEQAFPSKTADYLRSGTPILIFAPPYSSIVKYARQFRLAEIVDEPSAEKLAEGIVRIWQSPGYRAQLRVNSLGTLNANHDINKQRAGLRKMMYRLVQDSGFMSKEDGHERKLLDQPYRSSHF